MEEKTFVKPNDLNTIEDVLSRKEILTLNEDKNQTDIIKTIEKAREKLGSYECVYVIDAFKNVTTLRAFNRVLFEIDKSSTFAFYDNENIFYVCFNYIMLYFLIPSKQHLHPSGIQQKSGIRLTRMRIEPMPTAKYLPAHWLPFWS